MEFYADLDFISLYIESISLAIEIPTWLLVGTIAFIYSIRLIRRDNDNSKTNNG
jgi:hypothetical protein